MTSEVDTPTPGRDRLTAAEIDDLRRETAEDMKLVREILARQSPSGPTPGDRLRAAVGASP